MKEVILKEETLHTIVKEVIAIMRKVFLKEKIIPTNIITKIMKEKRVNIQKKIYIKEKYLKEIDRIIIILVVKLNQNKLH